MYITGHGIFKIQCTLHNVWGEVTVIRLCILILFLNKKPKRLENSQPIAVQSIKYTHIFAHMITISSQLQRFSTKRPPWVEGANQSEAVIKLFLIRGGLKEGLPYIYIIYIYIYI